MDVRSTLSDSPRRTVVGVVVVLVAVVGAAVALGILGSPTVTGVENRFGGVNESATVVESNLTVSNPNPVGASLGGLTVDYAVEMNGVRMAEGTKAGVSVPPGQSVLPFRTTLANDRIPTWWVSHVRNDERTTLTVDAAVHSSAVDSPFGAPQVTRTVETDLLSEFDSTEPRPVNASAPLVTDPVVYVNETSASWGAVTTETTELDLAFVVYNPKPYPVGMTEVGYDVSMNDVTLGEGATDGGVVIPPGETRTIETTTRIRNENLDEWWVTHVERNQVSELEIDFAARLDLQATTIEVPLTALTYTKTVETDVFGTKPESTATASGAETTSGSDRVTTTETAVPDGRTTTATTTTVPTATPAPTTTDVPTPTDDGGLLNGGEATRTPEPESTPTDDGGLLGETRAPVR
ncbi:LEA type 2 family protein [Salinigranum marinum]|uniref:LEA type 2 family protein n=1 Tax=Salinigranum marinum TaxID=1515595 RepID=UPI002989D738|nr:LEA type 2 family protein [Salinigranum marinum]